MNNAKVLLVFCDGTGMDGTLTSDLIHSGAVTSNKNSTKNVTNVLRLSRAVKPLAKDGRRQIVLYQSGVGSEADFDGDFASGGIFRQALGSAVASKIRDAYAFIAQNFEPGDEICIFGFSRGAYTARKLAGLIDAIGLLETRKLGLFFGVWKDLIDKKPPQVKGRTTRIKCVGVWDTVGSVYDSIDALSIKDNQLPSSIDVALHALSLQENRKRFLPTLWSTPHGLFDTPRGEKQVLKQIWFPGAHSDVGGGYARRELADISLYWMAGEIRDFINLDLAFLRQTGQVNPDPWGTSQPHNAFKELSAWEERIIGHATRLENKDITSDSQYHSSLMSAPLNLTADPDYMITLTTLKTNFGKNWTPDCVALNSFEEECKSMWGSPSNTHPPGFEAPEDLCDLTTSTTVPKPR